jgi:hypothetical protein
MQTIDPTRLATKQAEWRKDAIKSFLVNLIPMVFAALFCSYFLFETLNSANPDDLREGARRLTGSSYWEFVALSSSILVVFNLIVARLTAGPYPTQKYLEKDDAITRAAREIVMREQEQSRT